MNQDTRIITKIRVSKVLNDLTIVIKTFERPGCLEECISSIRQFYPKIRIIVADDSENGKINNRADEYYFLPFDSGLSYGRNFLLSKVRTRFVMFLDDDTVFTDGNCLERMLSILGENDEIDLVAGNILGNSFFGCLEKEGKFLYREQNKHRTIINNHKIYDYVLNLFIARADKVRDVQWNEELKIVEHMDFFWRAKGKINSTRVDNCVFRNTSRRNKKYSKFRVERIREFMKKQCELLGVESIKDRMH